MIDIESIQKNAEAADENTLEDQIGDIDKRYHALKNKMKKMKQEELERIGREFLLNSYEKRFKVNQDVILAAIVGEDKAKAAMAN